MNTNHPMSEADYIETLATYFALHHSLVEMVTAAGAADRCVPPEEAFATLEARQVIAALADWASAHGMPGLAAELASVTGSEDAHYWSSVDGARVGAAWARNAVDRLLPQAMAQYSVVSGVLSVLDTLLDRWTRADWQAIGHLAQEMLPFLNLLDAHFSLALFNSTNETRLR